VCYGSSARYSFFPANSGSFYLSATIQIVSIGDSCFRHSTPIVSSFDHDLDRPTLVTFMHREGIAATSLT